MTRPSLHSHAATPARSLWRAVAIVVGVALLVGLVGVAAVMAAERFLRAPIGGDRVQTFLLLGSDGGPMRRSNPLSARADAIHLLFVSTDGRHATFVNVPRDAYVSVPGRGRTRVNACLNAGPERCVATMEANFGVNIDHYLVTDFSGLMSAVNRFGGVEIDVPTPVSDGGEAVSAGRHRLSGAQALAFTRDRKHRSGGDFERTGAQGSLLQAAHAQLVRERANVGRIAEMAGLVQQTTMHDMKTHELVRYGYRAMNLPPSNVANVTLPGRAGRAGAASVVFLADRASAIIADAADDGRVG